MTGRTRLRAAIVAAGGLGVVVAGLTGMARVPRPADVTARLGPITVSATSLHRSPSGTLTASIRVSTTGRRADQLDAAIAADGAPAGVYHQVISLADMPDDVASCGGGVPPGGAVQRWMHYGPLTVPGKSSAGATLTLQRTAPVPTGTVTVTFYFANAGPVSLRLPVS